MSPTTIGGGTQRKFVQLYTAAKMRSKNEVKMRSIVCNKILPRSEFNGGILNSGLKNGVHFLNRKMIPKSGAKSCPEK